MKGGLTGGSVRPSGNRPIVGTFDIEAKTLQTTKQTAEQRTPEKPPGPSGMVPETVAFIGTLALAYWFSWSTKDLIWSLWLSSLCIGFLSVAASAARRVVRRDAMVVERIFSLVGGIGALLFFSIHFGSFHYVYASILDLLMPLMAHPDRVYVGRLTWSGGISFSFWETLALAMTQYWPVAALNVLGDRRTMLTDGTDTKDVGPYLAILKLHFIVMGLGACYGLGLESFPVYAAVFTLLYAPTTMWKRLFRRNA
ncbi:MAG: hypothetical protein HW389_971 [Bacteroidetes bacterium]|nr:hypothetical protein [Bacteroidota bacterium]